MEGNLLAQIYEVLQQSASENEAKRKEAEFYLSQCEKQPNSVLPFALISIAMRFAQDSNPPQFITLAAIHLKNVLSRYWSSNEISEEYKDGISKEIIQKLPEIQSDQIARLFSASLAEICLKEVTHDVKNSHWKSLDYLVEVLSNAIEEGDSSFLLLSTNNNMLKLLNHLRRLLLPLHYVMKFLITNHFDQMIETIPPIYLQNVLSVVSEKWYFAITVLSETLENDDVDSTNQIEFQEEQEMVKRMSEVCSLSIKLIRKISHIPFKLFNISKDKIPFEGVTNQSTLISVIAPDLHTALMKLPSLFNSLLKGRGSQIALRNNQVIKKLIEKQVITGSKTILELIKLHPEGVSTYLSTILPFYISQLFLVPSINAISPMSFEHRFLVFCLNILSYSFEMRIPEKLAIITNIFTGNSMEEFIVLIITRFFPVSNEEIKMWEQEPQELIQEQLYDTPECAIKPAVEFLWISLIRNFPAHLVPMSLKVLNHFIINTPKDNIMGYFFALESCFHALSLCRNEFHSHIDINEYLKNALLPALQSSEPISRLLKRQFCQMLSDGWQDDIHLSLIQNVLQLLVQMLEENDYVIAVWSSIALKSVSSVDKYSKEIIQLISPKLIENLLLLANKLKHDSLTVIIITTLTRLCEKMEKKLLADVISQQIINGLIKLWEINEDSHLLRNTILRGVASIIDYSSETIIENSNHQLQYLQFENSCVLLVDLSTNGTGKNRDLIYANEGLRIWLALIERGDIDWVKSRYPQNLASRFAGLLSLPLSQHVDPVSMLSIIQHLFLILRSDFEKNYSKELLSYLSQIFNHPEAKSDWKLKAIGLMHTMMMESNSISPLIEEILKLVIRDIFLNPNINAKNSLHSQLFGLFERALILNTSKVVSMLSSFSIPQSSLQSTWQILNEELMKDAILGRLNCLALVKLFTDNTQLYWSWASFILSNCAVVYSVRFPFQFNTLIAINPLNNLRQLYVNLWENDFVNKINIESTVLQSSSFAQVFPSVNPLIMQKLQGSGNVFVVFPTFERRNY